MQLGKLLIGLGVLLLIAGTAVILFDRVGLPLGRLPGDIAIERGNSRFYFPLMTCLLLSAVLSLVMWLLQRFR